MKLCKTHYQTIATLVFCLYPFTAQSGWMDKALEYYNNSTSEQTAPENQSEKTETQKSEESVESSSAVSSKNSDTNLQIEAAFRQALDIGTEKVVSRLGIAGGFSNDAKVHINLPKSMQKVARVLNRFGYGNLTDELELKLNQAAEKATPQAKALFIDSIKQMSFNDIQEIYRGSSDSATLYLKSKTADKIRSKMAPIVAEKLQEVGALKLYDQVMKQYMSYPLVPNISADLQSYVLDKGVDGIFFYLAQEEKAIRENPAKQTTELLKKVFTQ